MQVNDIYIDRRVDLILSASNLLSGYMDSVCSKKKKLNAKHINSFIFAIEDNVAEIKHELNKGE